MILNKTNNPVPKKGGSRRVFQSPISYALCFLLMFSVLLAASSCQRAPEPEDEFVPTPEEVYVDTPKDIFFYSMRGEKGFSLSLGLPSSSSVHQEISLYRAGLSRTPAPVTSDIELTGQLNRSFAPGTGIEFLSSLLEDAVISVNSRLDLANAYSEFGAELALSGDKILGVELVSDGETLWARSDELLPEYVSFGGSMIAPLARTLGLDASIMEGLSSLYKFALNFPNHRVEGMDTLLDLVITTEQIGTLLIPYIGDLEDSVATEDFFEEDGVEIEGVPGQLYKRVSMRVGTETLGAVLAVYSERLVNDVALMEQFTAFYNRLYDFRVSVTPPEELEQLGLIDADRAITILKEAVSALGATAKAGVLGESGSLTVSFYYEGNTVKCVSALINLEDLGLDISLAQKYFSGSGNEDKTVFDAAVTIGGLSENALSFGIDSTRPVGTDNTSSRVWFEMPSDLASATGFSSAELQLGNDSIGTDMSIKASGVSIRNSAGDSMIFDVSFESRYSAAAKSASFSGDVSASLASAAFGAPSAGSQSASAPSTGSPSASDPSADTPSDDTPSAGSLPSGSLSASAPLSGSLSASAPASGTPASGTPSADNQLADSLSVGSLSAGSHSAAASQVPAFSFSFSGNSSFGRSFPSKAPSEGEALSLTMASILGGALEDLTQTVRKNLDALYYRHSELLSKYGSFSP